MLTMHDMFRRDFALLGLVDGVVAGDLARRQTIGDHVEALISVLHRHHRKIFTRAPDESMCNTTDTIRGGADATFLDTAGQFTPRGMLTATGNDVKAGYEAGFHQRCRNRRARRAEGDGLQHATGLRPADPQ
jgi:acyl-coenzyme A thioesterase PaaI-like protein